jgi:hypothetical protein
MRGFFSIMAATAISLAGATAASAQREEMPLLRTSELKIDPASCHRSDGH